MMIRRLFLVLALLLPLTLSLPALAGDALDAAKAAGQVGEQRDGLLGIVSNAPPAVQALVRDVNARRMDVFRGIAAKNGQSLAAVQAVSGEEFIARTASGNYIQSGNGQWVKKP